MDWYEAVAEIDGERLTVQIFNLRSMASGAAFRRAYPHATLAGPFSMRINRPFTTSAESLGACAMTTWRAPSKKFCADAGAKRLNASSRFVPTGNTRPPSARQAKGTRKAAWKMKSDTSAATIWCPYRVSIAWKLSSVELLEGCRADFKRVIEQRPRSVGEMFAQEQPLLLPLPEEDFDLVEESFYRVNEKGCVQVRSNFYSAPLRPGTQARVRVSPTVVEVHHQGQCVATHARSYDSTACGHDPGTLPAFASADDCRPERTTGRGSRALQSGKYAGQWVALDGGRLIAHSASHDEVAEAAKADGAYLPLITFVEPKPARPFVRV